MTEREAEFRRVWSKIGDKICSTNPEINLGLQIIRGMGRPTEDILVALIQTLHAQLQLTEDELLAHRLGKPPL